MHQNETEAAHISGLRATYSLPCNEDANVGLTLSPRLNVLVKPLSRFGKGSNTKGLTAPYTDHRDYQKDQRGSFEEQPTEVTATERTDDAEDS